MKIHKVITNSPYQGRDKERIKNLFAPAPVLFVNAEETKEEIKQKAKNCDVAFWTGNLEEEIWKGSSLKWIHFNMAGLNSVAKKEMFQQGIHMTGAAGRSAPTLSEHAFFFMLNHAYQVKDLIEAQKKKQWGFEGISSLRGLYGKKLGIAGFGHTGKAVAEKAKAFGMHVTTYSHTPLTDDEIKKYHIEKDYNPCTRTVFHDFVSDCDYLVLALRLTDDTYHLCDKETFSHMSKNAFLVNMSRGSVIDETALIEAVDKGIISGAGIDVTEEEPLQKESRIWEMDTIFLTPHFTPMMPNMKERCLDILEENIQLYLADQPLKNEIKASDMYTHS